MATTTTTTSPSASGCDATLNEVIIIGSNPRGIANGLKRPAATRMAKKGLVGRKEEVEGPSAHHQTKGRRALATKVRTPSSTVAVVITFITIFTFIVALEVLFIDETRNPSSSSSATEESSENNNNGFLHLAPAKRQISRFAGGGVGDLPRDDVGAPSEITFEPAEANANTSTGDWQPVLGTREKFYVYSAYFDGRQGHTVRVIGATRTRGTQRVTCLLHYKGNSAPVLATIKVIRENWNLKYSAVFVLCPLYDQTVLPVPEDVSIVAGEGYLIGNRIPVLHHNVSVTSALPPEGFGVCVKPLHYNFNRALQLIEFVELNRILGVGHFTFYNHTIGPDVECVLRAYTDERVVTLLPWDLDMLSQKEIRTEGLFAAINDCLYRHMHSFRYLLMIDMDEFIVPHRNDELPSMLHELSKKVDGNRAGSFSFMNSFFYLQWPNDSNSRGLEPLVTLLKTRRRAKFHPHKQRSKCIVVPRFVVEMGNHFVWEFLPGKGAVNVPPEVAFLHHYRVCEFGGNDCVKTASVTDRTVYKFKNELLLRVAERLRKTRRVCPEIKI